MGCTLALFGGSDLGAQEPRADTVLVAPGPGYAAGWLARSALGGGWRDLWTTALSLPVADLTTLEGGLEILEVGGGTTTATLHVRTPEGRRFVFRTVDKDPLTGAMVELEGTILGTAFRDQMSAFNPVGALVVPRLLEAVGVLHATPRLYVFPVGVEVPGDPSRFAGKVVLFEERPDELPGREPGFGGYRNFVSTQTLRARVRASDRDRVASDELLRARLVDLLVGDRDRAVSNWRWAAEDRDGVTVWHPIPRDRDQAFARFNGVVKRIVSLWEPRLTIHDDPHPSVEGLTHNAWDIDRRFLVDLDRPVWDSIVREVGDALTDEVLGEAVDALPPEVRSAAGDPMYAGLQARRARLVDLAEDLYRLVNRQVDVWATDGADSLHVEATAEGGLGVELYARSRSAEPVPLPYMRRVFDPGETREIRVYLLEGDDRAVVAGADIGPEIWIVGGPGGDTITAEGSNARVRVVDAGRRTGLSGSGRVSRIRVNLPSPVAWGDSATGRDWGNSTHPLALARYSSDLGPMLGAGFARRNFGLLRRPYETEVRLEAGYAARNGRGLVRAVGRRGLGVAGPWLELQGGYSGVERLRFYGFGNESSAGRSTEAYRILHDEFGLRLTMEDTVAQTVTWAVAPVLRLTSTDTVRAQTLLAEVRPYGAGRFTQVGLTGSIRRCPLGSASGIMVRRRRIRCSDPGLGSVWSALASAGVFRPLDQPRSGAFAAFDGRVAAQGRLGDRAAVAARVGGRLSFGDVPFHEKAYLGGSGTLRGYAFDRFVGDRSFFAGVEARVWISTVQTAWFPLDVGLIGLVDVGRVWVSGEDSSVWHSSWGGGVWLAPFKRDYAVHVIVVRSPDGTRLYGGPRFAY